MVEVAEDEGLRVLVLYPKQVVEVVVDEGQRVPVLFPKPCPARVSVAVGEVGLAVLLHQRIVQAPASCVGPGRTLAVLMGFEYHQVEAAGEEDYHHQPPWEPEQQDYHHPSP